MTSPSMQKAKYRTIVADPPWRYRDNTVDGAAEAHYPTMSMSEIKALSVPAANNAHLYLWTTNTFLPDAFEVMEAWGFVHKTVLTWVKPRLGLGRYFRNTTEHVIFGVRGRLPLKRKDLRTHFDGRCGRHSEKPDSFYDLVETASPGPYLELFARRVRLGWHGWGNEWYSEAAS